MDYVFILTLILLSSTQAKSQGIEIKSARLLDLLLRDYIVKTFNNHIKTGTVQSIQLPPNFSGIKVDTAKFRCGSLRRYGAQFKEFRIDIGVTIQPCAERVILITQNLGKNWSSIYYTNYDLSRYQLISPILGLLAYNAGSDLKINNPYELGILAGDNQITINFTKTPILSGVPGIRPLCAFFEADGKVIFQNQKSPGVCVATKQGHFGLVVEMPPSMPVRKRISKWKVAVGSSIGAAIGAFLLGLLLVAMVVKVKKKARIEEMERRAYEEEALQVSMVGHVRAPTASATRTSPIIEHQYFPYPS